MTDPAVITIERCGEQHADQVAALYSDPQVARQVLQLPFQPTELWRKRIVAMENERNVGLVALHQGQVIGLCSLQQHERVRLSHGGAVGMGVAAQWQGKGVGSRLLAAVLDVADNWMNLRRVELTVYTDNQAAVALYRKFGFEIEGELRDYAVRDGQWVNAYTMARLRTVAS
ncbi:MAG: GNAT family N-acetyltransferase [Pseudomonas sp.]|uniref:GNAT family N-acetyltransferase n=1 Tax=Pseudomonas abieticivorans TaxID=2931382 RepID=UPI0020BDD505|nr:GNAT family N-acetyltransferase [Pseudomonas sp. PIA16]MDE1166269.1 GNAT family N-acetyltransferase [Pseudomonas sp.]